MVCLCPLFFSRIQLCHLLKSFCLLKYFYLSFLIISKANILLDLDFENFFYNTVLGVFLGFGLLCYQFIMLCYGTNMSY